MPPIDIGRQIRNLLTFLEIQGARKALIIGARYNQPALILAEKGFEVTIFDSDVQRLNAAGKELEEKKLKAVLISSSLDLKIGYYDFALAYNTIYKRTHQELRDRLTVFFAYLKEDGFFYITLASTRNANYGKGKEIEHNTFDVDGVVYHFCDAVEIVKMLRHVEIIDLRNEDQVGSGGYHWHILGRNRDPYPPEEDEISESEGQ